MSNWKPQQKVEGKWYSNGETYATKEESDRSASSKYSAWVQSEGWQSIEVDAETNPVTFQIVDGVQSMVK
jgi:hypothetical protein